MSWLKVYIHSRIQMRDTVVITAHDCGDENVRYSKQIHYWLEKIAENQELITLLIRHMFNRRASFNVHIEVKN